MHTDTMAGNESSLSQLELIRERDLSDGETNVLAAFDCAMHPARPETAAEVAQWLDYFCPPLEQEEEAQDYIWTIWETMLNVARSPDVTSEIHERLVSIVEHLRQCAKGEMDVYGVGIDQSNFQRLSTC